MPNHCYLNGKIISADKAQVSIYDIGLQRGFGVFDFLRVYDGQPFLLAEHLARLANSAKLLNLKVPLTAKQIAAMIKILLKKNKLKDATVRIVLTGGHSPDGINYDYKAPTFFILIKPVHDYPKSFYQNGVKVITFDYQREPARAKTNNYLKMLSLQKIKQQKKAAEIIYFSQGLILEGATSNFFVFKKNTLVTPKDDILIGATRNFVIKLARKEFKVAERPLKVSELKQATEAFITSTTREILPVVKIDNLKIGNGKVGKNTKILMELFQNNK